MGLLTIVSIVICILFNVSSFNVVMLNFFGVRAVFVVTPPLNVENLLGG